MLGDIKWSNLDKIILRFIFMVSDILTDKTVDKTVKDIMARTASTILSGKRCIFEKHDSLHLPSPSINQFMGIWVDGKQSSDIFEIVTALKSDTSICDIKWSIMYPSDIYYSETVYAFRQVEKSLQMGEDTRNLRLSNSSSCISIYMSVCAILNVLMEAFQVVNPIKVSLSTTDISDSRINDKILLEYAMTVRSFINYWATSLHQLIINEVQSYAPEPRHFYYQFIPIYNVYFIRSSCKGHPRKRYSDICQYKLALTIGQIHEYELDIPDDDE